MSKLGFGFMRLPLIDATVATSIDIPLLTQMVDLYMSRGNNYFGHCLPLLRLCQ